MRKSDKDVKSIVKVSPTQVFQHRTVIPNDYHCVCEYCRTNFLGEIYDVLNNKPYSAAARYSYYPPKREDDMHLDTGHFQGYRWAIHQFTKPGDWILDPTVGTGTTIVEAINNNRNAIGVELEYSHLTQENIDAQYAREKRAIIKTPMGEYLFRQGDAKNIASYLEEWGVEKESLQLIINGTPYPTMKGKSSDAPERKRWKIVDGERVTAMEKTFDYNMEDNMGKKSGSEFWGLIETMYMDSVPYLKPGGYFITIIKDMIQNKSPYLLHKMVTDLLMEHEDLEYHGCFIHSHWPPTLHMLTYPKRFPEVDLPLYQTGIVLRKKVK
jgi:hypothetical protein